MTKSTSKKPAKKAPKKPAKRVPNKAETPTSPGKPSQATLVFALAEGQPLGLTPSGTAVIKLTQAADARAVPLDGDLFKGWLAKAFLDRHGTTPSPQAVKQAIGMLRANTGVLAPGGATADFEVTSEVMDADAPVPGPSSAGGGGSQADILVELCNDIEFFHTPDDVAFASFKTNGHTENHPVKSRRFKRQVQYRFYTEEGGAPGGQALETALGVMEAKALFDGPEFEVHLRVAEHDGHIYIDLANDGWEAVQITSSGWRKISDPPVRFWRTRGMQALPAPVPGGSMNDLRPFVNVAASPVSASGGPTNGLQCPVNIPNDDAWYLLLGWLVGALRPRGPFVLLAVQGGQGAAKSTACRVLRALLDPSTAPLRRLPRDEQNLAIAAHNARVLVFDNVSGLADWTSDALCTVSTGGGLATRELYSDSDEILFNSSRPMVVNGIDDIATRPDLADRSILLVLAPIEEGKRQDEHEFWTAFETKRPIILGALFDAVSVALRELPKVRLAKKPRMADFAKWVTAAEGAFGWPPGTFMEAYSRNRAASLQVTFDADIVAPLIVRLLGTPGQNGVWDGSATSLYDALEKLAPLAVVRSRKWPKAPNALGKHLRNRGAVPLAHAGVVLTDDRTGADGHREIHLELRRPGVPDGSTDGSRLQPTASGQSVRTDSTPLATDSSGRGSRQAAGSTQPAVTTVDFSIADGTDSSDGSSPAFATGAVIEETL